MRAGGGGGGQNSWIAWQKMSSQDVDVVVVDTAHGHSANVLETVREIKKRYDIQVIAGNVATEEGARDLIEAGADVR